MGRDNSWPTMVLGVVPSYSRADSNLISPSQIRFPHVVVFLYRELHSAPESAIFTLLKMAEPYFESRI